LHLRTGALRCDSTTQGSYCKLFSCPGTEQWFGDPIKWDCICGSWLIEIPVTIHGNCLSAILDMINLYVTLIAAFLTYS